MGEMEQKSAPRVKGKTNQGRRRLQIAGGNEDTRLPPVHLIVRADVEKNDIFLGQAQDRYDAMLIGQTHGMFALVSAFQRVQTKPGIARIGFNLSEDILEDAFQIGMTAQKLSCRVLKRRGPDQREPRGFRSRS